MKASQMETQRTVRSSDREEQAGSQGFGKVMGWTGRKRWVGSDSGEDSL